MALLGETSPPGLFDDQPEGAIFDPDGVIDNARQQLHPFSSFVHVIENRSDLNMFLRGKENSKVVLILIFSNKCRTDVIQFIDNHIHQRQSIHSLYLFFINGQQHETELRNLFTPLLIECFSITKHLHSEVRDTLSTANDLNIKFCSRRVKQEEAQDDKGVAFIYEQQYRERVEFQIVHGKCLCAEIDKDRP